MTEHYATAEYTEAVDLAFYAAETTGATPSQTLILLNEIAAGWVRESFAESGEV